MLHTQRSALLAGGARRVRRFPAGPLPAAVLLAASGRGVRHEPRHREPRARLHERVAGGGSGPGRPTRRSAARWASTTMRGCRSTSRGSGNELAAVSHRPDLPWQFTVIDSPVVNAFAVPGGYIYLTRGLLAYLNDEAELAGVLGHEIGHVTARHSVQAYSRAAGAQMGLLLGQIFVPAMRPRYGAPGVGDAAGQGLGVVVPEVRARRRTAGGSPGGRVCGRFRLGPARRRRHADDAGTHRGHDRPPRHAQLARHPSGAGRPGGRRCRHRRVAACGNERPVHAAGRPRGVPGPRGGPRLRRQPRAGRRPRPGVPASGPPFRARVSRRLGGAQRCRGRRRPRARAGNGTCCCRSRRRRAAISSGSPSAR